MNRMLYLPVLILLFSCEKMKDTGLHITVLEDITEIDFVARPNGKSIISQFGFQKNLWSSVSFKYGTINSLTFNTRETISLEAENKLLGNELERRQKVLDFTQEIEAILKTPKDSPQYNQSSIWLPLSEELESSKGQNHKKVIYLFSDLRENTSWFSTYRPSDMEVLLENPDAVSNLFLEQVTDFKPSSNVKVIVVYQPSTIKEDEMFKQMRGLYAKLFKRIGIPIQFIPNLNDIPE